MLYSDTLNKNASIMEAYIKMSESTKEKHKEPSKKEVEKVEKELEKVASELKEDSDEAHFSNWMDSVRKANPHKPLKFKNRIERGVHTTSAEVSGEDRSYGVYDHDTKDAHVFHESFINEEKLSKEQLSKREEIVKGMKANMADFTRRYGDRAKDVMYATATKKVLDEGMDAPRKLHPINGKEIPKITKDEYLEKRKQLQKIQLDPSTSKDPLLKRELAYKHAQLRAQALHHGIITESQDLLLEETSVHDETGAITIMPDKGSFVAYGKTFETNMFNTPAEANAFMSSPEGQNHGYIGCCPDGKYHVAHMDDMGS